MRTWGEAARVRLRTPKPHWEIGEALGILDFERAAKLSGSRFSILRGPGARLSRALAAFFLDRAARNGYVEIDPPCWFRVRRCGRPDSSRSSPTRCSATPTVDLFLIPTAEVPLTAMHRDEILAGDVLPLQYAAHTPCFRKEAGAAGKDTRGLIRQHQFEKVELVWLTHAERSFDDLERLTAHAGGLLEELGPRVSRDAAVRRRHRLQRGEDVTTSKCGCPSDGGTVSRDQLVFELHRLSGPARRRCAFAATRRPSPNSSTRSTARGSRSAARWSPCSRTISAPTAGSTSRRCCSRSPASRRSNRTAAREEIRHRRRGNRRTPRACCAPAA